MNSSYEIRMPQLGLTMTEGLLVEWSVEPGGTIEAGEILCVVETDKIANEIPADRTGTLGCVVVQPGETVPVGTVIAQWLVDGEMPSLQPPVSTQTTPVQPELIEMALSDKVPRPIAAKSNGRIVATPHARKLARAHRIDLANVIGSGPKGRIKGADILALCASTPKREGATVGGERHRLSGLQQTIARRMQQVAREVPHFYLAASAEISCLLAMHQQLKSNDTFDGLTITHWLVSAVGMVLATDSLFNSVFANGDRLDLGAVDVALAVAVEQGLYAPVIRDVGNQSLSEIIHATDEQVRAARDGTISSAAMSGGASCVSNLGAMGIGQVLPLINPGQSSILGVGETSEIFRPDDHGAPMLKREINLTLALDHRLFNGVEGARMLSEIKRLLENPALIVAHTGRS